MATFYRHFEFNSGNPYICFTDWKMWDMVCKYYLTQYSAHSYYAEPRPAFPRTRENYKHILRAFAQEWQARFNEFSYSYSDLAEFGAFFEHYGRKYGLLREFRENGIL